jgi:hypothetical protein
VFEVLAQVGYLSCEFLCIGIRVEHNPIVPALVVAPSVESECRETGRDIFVFLFFDSV